jgi:hypothetical protein
VSEDRQGDKRGNDGLHNVFSRGSTPQLQGRMMFKIHCSRGLIPVDTLRPFTRSSKECQKTIIQSELHRRSLRAAAAILLESPSGTVSRLPQMFLLESLGCNARMV